MAQCFKLLRFLRLRVARLEPNGVPDPGADNLYVTDSQISLAIGYNNRAGDDFEQPNGAGDICFAFLEPDKYKNLTFALSVCDHSPEFYELLIGGGLIEEGGESIGHSLPLVGTAGNTNGVSMEGWSHNIEGSGISADYPYVRHVFGKTTWVPADKTLENNPIVSAFTGVGYENDNLHDGVGNDFPADAITQSNSLYMWFGDTLMPDAVCGAQVTPVS